MSGEARDEASEPVPAAACHFFGSGSAFLVLSGPCAEAHLLVAAEVLEERLERLTAEGLPDWIDFQVMWADALETAHRELADDLLRRDLPAETDLSISCTTLVVGGDQFFLAHLGRGRPMLFRNQFLQQIGKEHTEAFEALGKGEIKASEVPTHPGSRRLTRGLGIPVEDAMMATAAAFKKGNVQTGDRFLIPAAEVVSYASEENLLDALGYDSAPVDACEELVTAAREAGAPGAGCLRVDVQDGSAPRWGAADEGDPIPEPPPARPKPPPPVVEEDDEAPNEAQAGAPPASSPGIPAGNPLDDVPTMPPPPPEFLAAMGFANEPLTDFDTGPPPPPMPPELLAGPSALESEPPPDEEPPETPEPPPEEEPPPPPAASPPPRPRRPPRVDLPEPDRWVDIERTSRLDTTFAVGASLLASILLMAGLFWESLLRH
jgi:serine/threonine protein phosphatase PrpC